MDQPPSNINDIYKSQGWNDAAAISADIASGGWKSKVGSSGGGNNVDLQAPSVLDFTEQAYAPADDALKAYIMAMRGQQKPLDVYSQLEQEAGLPQKRATAASLRENIGDLEDTIRRVEPNIAATTRESLVTEGQRAGMVEARKRPLNDNLSTLSTNLGRVEQGISADMQGLDTKTGLFVQGQQQELKPYELEYTAMNDRAARLVTGFTADAQNNLQILMAKWNRNNQLDDKETDQAFELLKLEKGYNNEMSKMQAQSQTDLAQYAAKQPIDLATYEAKKAIDDKNKTGSDGGYDTSPYYTTPTASSPANSSYYGTSGANNNISNLWNGNYNESSSATLKK